MNQREIKFKVFHKGSITGRIKVDGYERINANRWEWMSLELNSDKGERWSRGVYSWSDKYIRAQFTGLKDKNGVEIYEGDIISKGNVVEFSFGTFYINGDIEVSAINPAVEVIGNIYENPELK